MNLTCRSQASRDTLALHLLLSLLFFVRGPIAECVLQKIDCFLILEYMSLIEILKHVSVTLDEDLGVLLPMAQLFITVSLNTLQEIRHEGGLFLDHLVLNTFIFLMIFFKLCQLLKLLQLVS